MDRIHCPACGEPMRRGCLDAAGQRLLWYEQTDEEPPTRWERLKMKPALYIGNWEPPFGGVLQPDVWYCESCNLMLFRPCNSRRPR